MGTSEASLGRDGLGLRAQPIRRGEVPVSDDVSWSKADGRVAERTAFAASIRSARGGGWWGLRRPGAHDGFGREADMPTDASQGGRAAPHAVAKRRAASRAR